MIFITPWVEIDFLGGYVLYGTVCSVQWIIIYVNVLDYAVLIQPHLKPTPEWTHILILYLSVYNMWFELMIRWMRRQGQFYPCRINYYICCHLRYILYCVSELLKMHLCCQICYYLTILLIWYTWQYI